MLKLLWTLPTFILNLLTFTFLGAAVLLINLLLSPSKLGLVTKKILRGYVVSYKIWIGD